MYFPENGKKLCLYGILGLIVLNNYEIMNIILVQETARHGVAIFLPVHLVGTKFQNLVELLCKVT